MHTPNGLKAILFDFDGTIRYSRPSSEESFHRFVEDLGIPLLAETRHHSERWVHSYWADSAEMKADLTLFPRGEDEPAFWMNYLRKHLRVIGVTEDVDALAEVIHQRMETDHHSEDHVPPEVPPMLAALREAGVVLGLVSNRERPLDPHLPALGLEGAFHFTLAGGEIGQFKPAPGIFLHAAGMAGVEVHEAVYVGDNYYADVLGAAGAGMRQILVDPRGLFPEAECPVVRNVWEVPRVI